MKKEINILHDGYELIWDLGTSSGKRKKLRWIWEGFYCWSIYNVKTCWHHADYLPLTYCVAMEKRLCVWYNTCGTDNKIAAKCLPIGQLNLQRPWISCGETKNEQGLDGQQIHFTHELQARILTILSLNRLLEGDDFFHLTLVFH